MIADSETTDLDHLRQTIDRDQDAVARLDAEVSRSRHVLSRLRSGNKRLREYHDTLMGTVFGPLAETPRETSDDAE